jgi:hypothetical protein
MTLPGDSVAYLTDFLADEAQRTGIAPCLAGVNRYTLLHLSRRYARADWAAMAKTAQAVFPNSGYVAEWGI